MITTEYPYNNNENLVKTYSDEGYYIVQNETGKKYSIAVDAYPCKYTYSETNEKAPPKRTYNKVTKAQAAEKGGE